MKVCLFLEKKKQYLGSGIWKAHEHQKKQLNLVNVDYTENSSEDYDIFLTNSAWFTSYREMKKAKKKGKKVIVYAHMTSEDFRNSMILANPISILLRKWLNFVYSKADAIITPTEYTRNLLKEKYSKLSKKEIYVLSNGIDLAHWNRTNSRAKKFKKKLGLKRPLILSVGLVFKRKGILDFIEISKKLPHLDFVWIGKYKRLVARNLKIDSALKNAPSNFKYIGYVEDISGAYSAADVFFFPSFDENEGIVVLEAAAMGNALLLRDIPVFKSYLQEGKSYLSGSSQEEFISSINRILSDSNLKKSLGKNARKVAQDKDFKKNSKEFKHILTKISTGI